MTVLEITDDNYIDEVINHKGMVMVEFMSPKCGPCVGIKGNVAYAAEKHKDTLKVVTIDCLQHNRVAEQIGVQGYPFFLFYKDGVAVHAFRGAPADLDMDPIIHTARTNPTLKLS